MNVQQEVDNNFIYFKKHLLEFKKTHTQEFVLLHKEEAIDLGYQSYAII